VGELVCRKEIFQKGTGGMAGILMLSKKMVDWTVGCRIWTLAELGYSANKVRTFCTIS
jgi:hypothetical protein